ncbi:MAG: hypothetical protein CME19_07465 [Gemmatimonadetes bacterium]|nr:hypothetical protein [Gemmatimonadota bacterium]
MGLSVVQKTVDRHRGKINVTSHVDEGTAFVLRFPVL